MQNKGLLKRVVKSDGFTDQLECGHTWSSLIMSPFMHKVAKRRRCHRCQIEVKKVEVPQ